MKKLFTLLGALLLGQAMAVAQNYLHISQGDSAIAVPIAQLDSVTVRDAEYYTPVYYCDASFYDPFFNESWLDVAVYSNGYTYIVKEALVGKDLTFTYDLYSGVCTVSEQETGYEHPSYGIIRVRGNGYYNNNDNSFIFNLEYIVDAGSFGTYSAILQLPIPTAPARDRQEEDITPKATSELKATLQPNKQDDKATHMQLQPMNSREITQ